MAQYLVVDIETVPLDTDEYFDEDEEGRLEYLNPVDSKVIAVGIRSNGTNEVFIGEDESRGLEDFWAEWSAVKRGSKDVSVVGFNINEFDIPMLASRSFQNGVTISPFTLKEMVDLRERISAFQWRPKGTLHDFVETLGINPETGGGENVPIWYRNDQMDQIEEHLEEDLEITDELYQKAKELNITKMKSGENARIRA